MGRADRSILEPLCRRLQAGGDFTSSECPDSLAGELAEGLRRFQSRHGLPASGRLDPAASAALNVPLESRIGQVRRALEAWRQLPRQPGLRHVRVNIPEFRLMAFDSGREALSMKVVIGTLRDRTPLFSDRILAVELNPAWNVPGSIAREEVLPEVKRDPGFLARQGMEVFCEEEGGLRKQGEDSIDWSMAEQEGFHFRIRQRPGPANPLGRIKFHLSNPFSISLHDTPATGAFERRERALSHGCVRLEKPLDLAAWILGAESGWTPDRLAQAIDRGREARIPVPAGGMPIHILYWTAFVDSAGVLNFRPDIYGWDGPAGPAGTAGAAASAAP